LGEGAAGLSDASSPARGGPVLVVEHARAPGEKIRISGGGRCNFTNIGTTPAQFLSRNPHFAKSALARYSQHDFVDLVRRHGIAFHEKTLGQLFCDGSAREIVAMLLAEMRPAELRLGVEATEIAHRSEGFLVTLSDGTTVSARNLVVATGGKSIPKMGATGFGYRVAAQFGHGLVETRPGLVPLTFAPPLLDRFRALAGVSLKTRVAAGGVAFDEAMLFTHRGLSGPAVLQASSYWREGEEIMVDLCPGDDAAARLRTLRKESGRRGAAAALATFLPARLATDIATAEGAGGRLAEMSDARLAALGAALGAWRLKPAGSEGYRTAEVTLGGVDTGTLDARTMESRKVPGLFFIGEVVDVTGWLGGYNFQWAWSSAHAAGSEIARRGGA
jgi:predicted Rossmann fold flavoprotein